MSAGHHHFDGEDNGLLNSQVIDRILKNPEIRSRVYGFHTLNYEYDLPYLGGYSVDGKTIYLDRHLPSVLTLEEDGRKKEFNPYRHIEDHEVFEKAIMDVIGWGYEHAHHAANGFERRGVLRAGLFWNPYNRALGPYIKGAEHEKLKKVPADLDMRPYYFPPINDSLIRHMKKAMKRAV
jgi:hypothetical protein